MKCKWKMQREKNLTIPHMNANFLQTVVETTWHMQGHVKKVNPNCKICKKHPFPISTKGGGSYKPRKKNICSNNILYKYARKIQNFTLKITTTGTEGSAKLKRNKTRTGRVKT